MREKLKLVFPTIEYKDKAIDYINEFYEYGSEINGSGSLDSFLKESTYEKWIENVLSRVDIDNIQSPDVPALTYFCVREVDDRIVGMVNIRLALNDFLRTEGGNVGYSVRPTERRQGYATEILSEAVTICNKIGINNVLVSCEKGNVASSGVIKKCGGFLKNEFYSLTYCETLQMYEITH